MTEAGSSRRIAGVAAPVALGALVAVIVAVQLALLGAFGAEEEVRRRDGRRWAEAAQEAAPGAPALLWSVQELEVPGIGRVTSIAAAPTGPEAIAPLGADIVPAPGNALVSPGLAEQLEDVPAGLVDRQRLVGRLGDEVLARPDDLVVPTGWDDEKLADADPMAVRVRRFVSEERIREDEALDLELFPDVGSFLARLALVPLAAVPLAVVTVALLRRHPRPLIAALLAGAAGTVVGAALLVVGAENLAGSPDSPWFAADLQPSAATVLLVGGLTTLVVVWWAMVADQVAPSGWVQTTASAIVLGVVALATAGLVSAAKDEPVPSAAGRAAYPADVVLSGSELGTGDVAARPAGLTGALRAVPGVAAAVPVHRADVVVEGLDSGDLFDGLEVAVAACADAAAVLGAQVSNCPPGPALARSSARQLEFFPAYAEPVFDLRFGDASKRVTLRAVGDWGALDRPSWEGLVPPAELPAGLLDRVGPDEVALRTDGRPGTVAAIAGLARRTAPGMDVRVRGELGPGPAEDPWSALTQLGALPAAVALVGVMLDLTVNVRGGRRPSASAPSALHADAGGTADTHAMWSAALRSRWGLGSGESSSGRR